MKAINFTFFSLLLILQLNFINLFSSNDKNPLTISFSFETKYIHEIPNDSNEDYYDDYGYDYFDAAFSSQDMINEWFYNGLYISLEMGNDKKDIYLFLDVENSDFTIGPCNKINITSFPRLIKNYSYFFSNSSSFSLQEQKSPNDNKIYRIGKEIFTKENIELKFIINQYNPNEPICGNIGLNVLDKTSDIFETNLLKQFNNIDLISNYIWTINYRAEQFGNIILGGEPHIYDDKNYFLSQYKTAYSQIKINTNNEQISPWSFKFNTVYLNKTTRINKDNNNDNNIINLYYNEAELLIERGLIIGTEEYKKLIDKDFFNELFINKTCNSDIISFYNNVIGKESKYYVYSCDKEKFQGKDIYYRPEYTKPYFNFPSINFINKDLNYTFSLSYDNLFITKGRIYGKVFFLIIFEYEKENKIWKLGEPFLSKFKFVFNPDQKIIGFYNPNLPKIDNDIYRKNNMSNDNEDIYEKEKNMKKNYFWYYLFSITIIIILTGIIIFLATQLNKARKKRANELENSYNYEEVEDPITNEGIN